MTLQRQSGDLLPPPSLNDPLPLYARRTADNSLVNTTLTPDGVLFIPNLRVSGVYELELHLIFRCATAGTTPGMKLDFSLPAGAVTSGTTFRFGTVAAARTGAAGAITGITCAVADGLLEIKGLLLMGATAGTAQFRAAQNAASATAVIVAQDSYLRLIPFS